MEDGRGASALLAAARAGRVLNPMTEDEASVAGIERSRLHFRVDDGKANLAPPADKSTWFKLASVDLGNGHMGAGDSVGVVTPWEYKLPNPLDDVSVADLRAAQKAVSNGRWRESSRSPDWVGIAVADALGLDLAKKADKAKVKRLLQIWISAGMFVVVEGKNADYQTKSYVEVGEPASD